MIRKCGADATGRWRRHERRLGAFSGTACSASCASLLRTLRAPLGRLPGHAALLGGAHFARPLGAPAPAARAFAVRAADHVLQVIGAVIVGDLLARLDVAQGFDEDAAAPDDRFGVGITGMVEVARDIPARGAVDGAVGADLVKVAVAAPLGLFGVFQVENAARVFGDPGALLDGAGGEQAEPGVRAAKTEGARSHCDMLVQIIEEAADGRCRGVRQWVTCRLLMKRHATRSRGPCPSPLCGCPTTWPDMHRRP